EDAGSGGYPTDRRRLAGGFGRGPGVGSGAGRAPVSSCIRDAPPDAPEPAAAAGLPRRAPAARAAGADQAGHPRRPGAGAANDGRTGAGAAGVTAFDRTAACERPLTPECVRELMRNGCNAHEVATAGGVSPAVAPAMMSQAVPR